MAAKKPIAIDDYVRQWGSKVIRNTFAADDEENLRKGGDNLYFLLKKIVMDEGTKADLEIPLRVLRDMILDVWKQTQNNDRYRHTYMLVNMYDRVFQRVLSSIQEASQANDETRLKQEKQIMDELRSRLHKCVTGETWKDYPALRMVALRQVFTYHKESTKIADLLSKTSNGTSFSSPRAESSQKGGGWFGGGKKKEEDTSFGFSWEDTLDACVSASSEKLFPLLKILLTNGKAGTITMEGIVGVNLVAAAAAAPETSNNGVQTQAESNGTKAAGAVGSPAGSSSLIDLDFMGSKQQDTTSTPQQQQQQVDVTSQDANSTNQPETQENQGATGTPPLEEPKKDPFADLDWEKFE